jgi:hypothetical protein
MIRRALGIAALLALVAACSSGPGTTAPTTLPPTTRPPAPISPTGVVDQVRNWVTYLDAANDDGSWSVLGPSTQTLIGGRDQFSKVRSELTTTYGRFAKLPTTYDGLPIADGTAVVLVHAAQKDGSERAVAVPMRVVGDTWRAEPFLDTGRYRPVPADRTEVAALPHLSVVVQAGTSVLVWVDGQPATVAKGTATGIDELDVAYQPATGLVPGWHLVTLVFQRGDAIAARTVRYLVPEPK